MIASQMPADLKRARADWVIENVGSMEDLQHEVDRLWEELAKDGAPSLSGSNLP
jgi:dephospho-CoA kinase